jgi:hypothetical protein
VTAVRALALAIGAASVAAIAFGWMPTVQGSTGTTIGWGLTALLVANAILAGAIAGRARLDAAVIWSLAALAIGGLVAVMVRSFATTPLRAAALLWPREAFGYAIAVVGGLHAGILALAAFAAARRRARPPAELPAATVVRR